MAATRSKPSHLLAQVKIFGLCEFPPFRAACRSERRSKRVRRYEKRTVLVEKLNNRSIFSFTSSLAFSSPLPSLSQLFVGTALASVASGVFSSGEREKKEKTEEKEEGTLASSSPPSSPPSSTDIVAKLDLEARSSTTARLWGLDDDDEKKKTRR